MKVLFVASEASPFIKTGGLGDVMGALPPALKRLGLDVKVVLPKYKNMKYEFQQKLQFIKWFTVKVGWRNQYCGVSQCEYNGVTYYFLDNEYGHLPSFNDVEVYYECTEKKTVNKCYLTCQ